MTLAVNESYLWSASAKLNSAKDSGPVLCPGGETQHHDALNANACLQVQPLLEGTCGLSQEDAIYKDNKNTL